MKTSPFAIAFSFLILSGCVSFTVKDAESQFDQVVGSLRSQKPQPIINAEIKRFDKNNVVCGAKVAIPMNDSFQCVYAELGDLNLLSAVINCSAYKEPYEAMNCIQKNDKHLGKISASTISSLYEDKSRGYRPFKSNQEFELCIQKFSEELIGADLVRPTNNERNFEDCIAKARYGKKIQEIKEEDYFDPKLEELTRVNTTAPAIHRRICSSSEKPLIRNGSAKDNVALVLNYAYLRNLPELVNLRKVLKCE